MADLSGKQVAIIVENYIEEPELLQPKQALEQAGATVHIIASGSDDVQTVNDDVDLASKQPVDFTYDQVDFDDYDALVVPGGTVNADQLRTIPEAQGALNSVLSAGKPVAVICHGPWLLVSAGAASGRQVTSFKTLQDDLQNAGATWLDQEVVIDDNLITSRDPDDLPAFNAALIDMLSSR